MTISGFTQTPAQAASSMPKSIQIDLVLYRYIAHGDLNAVADKIPKNLYMIVDVTETRAQLMALGNIRTSRADVYSTRIKFAEIQLNAGDVFFVPITPEAFMRYKMESN